MTAIQVLLAIGCVVAEDFLGAWFLMFGTAIAHHHWTRDVPAVSFNASFLMSTLLTAAILAGIGLWALAKEAVR